MAEATAADCTAQRPLTLKLAAVYEPCALQVTRLKSWKEPAIPMTYGGGERGTLLAAGTNIFYRLGYCAHRPTARGAVALLEQHALLGMGQGYGAYGADGHLWAEAEPRRHVSQRAARNASSSPKF